MCNEPRVNQEELSNEQRVNHEKSTNEQLVIRIQAGIDVADNMLQLWEQNRGYIHKIANRYTGYADKEDLLQEGYIGLCTAVDHYNQGEGVPFMTYAGYWVRQQMSRYIRGNGTIRLPEFMYSRVCEYKRMVTKWQLSFGRKPTEQEIRHYLGLSLEQLDQVKKSLRMGQIGSLDVPVGEEEDSSMHDLLPGSDNQEEEILDRVQHEQLCNVLWGLVDELPGQQAEAIRERYQEGKTLKSIAAEWGITFEAVRQWEQKGLRELRKPKRSNQLRPFLEDRIYSRALRGGGVETFNRTWTSSTERAALLEAEEREWLKKIGVEA